MKMLRSLGFALVATLLPISAQAQGSLQAQPDLIITTVTRGPLNIPNVTANDLPAGTAKFLFFVNAPEQGRAELRPNNVIIYTPSRTFTGEDSFSYIVTSAPNGGGSASTGIVRILNPYLKGKGTYVTGFAGALPAHSNAGYLSVKVEGSGVFSAQLRYAGKTFRFRAAFNSAGEYTANISRGGGLPNLGLRIAFPQTGTDPLACDLIVGAETTSFSAQRLQWTSTNRPPGEGRYTFVLPAPDTHPATPQGNGFGVLVVSRAGIASILGRTGEDRSYSSITHYLPGNKVPVYAALNRGTGSLFGTLDVLKRRRLAAAIPLEPRAPVSGTLTWFKPRTLKDARFPAGYTLTLNARGAEYFEPRPGTPIVRVPTFSGFNSDFTVSGANIRTPRTEQSTIGPRPDAGLYGATFDNARRLRAALAFTPRSGYVSGSFYESTALKTRRFTGVVIQGEENAVFGIWNNGVKTGKAELVADPTILD